MKPLEQATPKELLDAAILNFEALDDDGVERGWTQASMSWHCLLTIGFQLGQPEGWKWISRNAWKKYCEKKQSECVL